MALPERAAAADLARRGQRARRSARRIVPSIVGSIFLSKVEPFESVAIADK